MAGGWPGQAAKLPPEILSGVLRFSPSFGLGRGKYQAECCAVPGTRIHFSLHPRLKPWAIILGARGARVVPGCPTYRVPQRGTKELSPARPGSPSCADFAQLGVVQRWGTGNKNSECRRHGRLPSNSLLPSLRDSARHKRLPRAYLHPITRKIGACWGPRNPPWAKSVSPSGLVCG